VTEFIPASFEPLTPLSFLDRSGAVYAERPAVVDGDRRFTYAELDRRCAQLAGGLAARGVEPGDRVAVLAPNVHWHLEVHFGVPRCGAVLVTLNHRLAAPELAGIIAHAGARILLHDATMAATATEVQRAVAGLELIECGTIDSAYEAMLAGATELRVPVQDELQLLALNYTSGTTGQPKGVMYNHRGAFLQAMAMAFHTGLNSSGVYLWTLPMFHCNGWTFPWAATAAGATHVCLPQVRADEIWRQITAEKVTHLCGAPTVLLMIAEEAERQGIRAEVPVLCCTGGAPPSPAILQRMERLGIEITHLYGLTESYGPSVICDWNAEWNELSAEAQAKIKARQGVGNVVGTKVRVLDENGADVPRDAATHGEIALRGNTVMSGYFHDDERTRQAIPDGWFRTGDVAVMHPDGYLEIRDRIKDIIISGGENIASIEIEQALVEHPAIADAAVVGTADEKWGEVPVAFVTASAAAAQPSDDELIAFLRDRLAGFKIPRRYVWGPLPKTVTGKTQKYVLRDSLSR
jgi:fatty-acyl-CoA synthase